MDCPLGSAGFFSCNPLVVSLPRWLQEYELSPSWPVLWGKSVWGRMFLLGEMDCIEAGSETWPGLAFWAVSK